MATPKTSDDRASSVVQHIRFAGRSSGAVKTLQGFRKGQHQLPSAVNATTTAFLGRLCADELAQEAEAFFQQARTLCGYKRREIALAVTSPEAVLTARDFSLSWTYALDPEDPGRWTLMRTLQIITGNGFLDTEAAAELFSGQFTELVFTFARAVPVDGVIDAVESLPDGDLCVNYPSDCSRCVISVPGVEAIVRFAGAELTMEFPRGAAPAELLAAFLAVRHAFSLTKDRTLAGLLG